MSPATVFVSITIVLHCSSKYSNFHRRKDIRTTWAADTIKQGIRVIFHLGVDTSITDEQQEELGREIIENEDILQQNFVDNYQNLTSMKTFSYLSKIVSVQSRVHSC